MASSYGREIFAVPGRITYINSYGNNYLLSRNIASIYLKNKTIPTCLGWSKNHFNIDVPLQKSLFTSESDDKIKVLSLVKKFSNISVDKLIELSGINFEQMSIILLDLELEGQIVYNFNGYSLRL